MLALLTVTVGPEQGHCRYFGRQNKVTIGRATNATICLTDAQASRIHCEVSYDGDRVVVTDAGSATGTFVNGTQIRAPQELRAGDVILVGQTQLSFAWSDTDQSPTEAWPPTKPNPS